MPTYDPAGHHELSIEADQLGPDALAAKADRAESVLGITGTAYTGAEAETLRLAVALQVNHLIRLEERGGAGVVQESKGDQSVTYARGRSGAADVVDPEAALLVARVLAVGEAPAVAPPATSSSTRIVFGW